MRVANKKAIALLSCFVLISLSGCTNWKKKYEALNVEHQNLKGLLERERAEKGQLADQVSQGQMTIAELERKIAERQEQPTGFEGIGEVEYDPTKGTITVTLPNEILFAPGKADLRKTTSGELDHIRSVLREKYAGKQVDVVGHTDSDPIKKSKWKDNWELSAQRSLTVARYLIERGISEEKIRAVGCGESRPVASNATAGGKARNRRVEIVVHMR